LITRPSTPELVELVRHELATNVAPQLTDPSARIALDMALHVLSTVANRSANEIAWMQRERERAEELANLLIEQRLDDGRIAAALAALRAVDPDDLTLDGASRRYDRAAEVLSCCVENIYASGQAELIESARTIFDERLANERAIIGVFEAVGRT
jgi:hypothetical protein